MCVFTFSLQTFSSYFYKDMSFCIFKQKKYITTKFCTNLNSTAVMACNQVSDDQTYEMESYHTQKFHKACISWGMCFIIVLWCPTVCQKSLLWIMLQGPELCPSDIHYPAAPNGVVTHTITIQQFSAYIRVPNSSYNWHNNPAGNQPGKKMSN